MRWLSDSQSNRTRPSISRGTTTSPSRTQRGAISTQRVEQLREVAPQIHPAAGQQDRFVTVAEHRCAQSAAVAQTCPDGPPPGSANAVTGDAELSSVGVEHLITAAQLSDVLASARCAPRDDSAANICCGNCWRVRPNDWLDCSVEILQINPDQADLALSANVVTASRERFSAEPRRPAATRGALDPVRHPRDVPRPG